MENRSIEANSVISMNSVSKCYGSETVVSDVSFKVQAGECIVLVGHNGAGKTTLMKLMLGLTKPTSGRVTVLGANPAFSAAVAQHKTLGYLPESVAFYEAMTGSEVLAFYASLKGASLLECETLLGTVGLAYAAKRRVGTYSKGMRQRLGLAQAMLGDPQLLFLDEPTTGLDPLLRQQFYELIDGLHEEGTTSVISSHALSEVEARADLFVIMKDGTMVACGTLDELCRLTALPIKIQISVAPGKAARVAEQLGTGTHISMDSNESLRITCANSEKMSLIRHISTLGEVVSDLQITQPKLDEVYNHFMQGDSSP